MFSRQRFRLILACTLLQAPLAHAAATYHISGFSPDYRATVSVEGDEKEVFRPGHITVFGKSGQQVLRVDADELAFEVADAKTDANVRELPYDQQSVLIFDDFNFDGRKDLALMDGQHSCYHGPSYQVFLGARAGFRPAPAFTRLAQDYCGFFEVDAKKRRLYTMTRSGCCWHEFSTFRVQGNQPVLQESTTEEVLGFSRYYVASTRTVHRARKVSTRLTYYWQPDAEAEKAGSVLLGFPLRQQPHKRVVVFRDDGDRLDYALLRNARVQVEFSAQLAARGYLPRRKRPEAGEDQGAWFNYRPAGELAFYVGRTHYRIIDTPERLGVEVRQGRSVTFIPGDSAGKTGSLRDLRVDRFQNLQLGPTE